ncbi:MAG: YqiJ family protein [Moraxella sp.]|nr:YqiJ family protein [Moraxella sp.]
MTWWQFVNAGQVQVFAIAIVLMLALGVLELMSLMFGVGSDWLDGLLPESLTEIQAEVGIDGSTGFIGFLSWLYLGKVPMLMWLVVFLTVFGLAGLMVQSVLWQMMGWLIPTLVAVPMVLIASLPAVRVSAKAIHAIMPKDETTAISQDSLVGRVGVITLGTAQGDGTAEVRVKDSHGQMHYVMASSDTGESLHQGESVLLVSGSGGRFKMIKNVNTALTD